MSHTSFDPNERTINTFYPLFFCLKFDFYDVEMKVSLVLKHHAVNTYSSTRF
jgi:hypothetical protein